MQSQQMIGITHIHHSQVESDRGLQLNISLVVKIDHMGNWKQVSSVATLFS